MGSVHKNSQLMLEFTKAPFSAVHSSYYTLITFLMMLYVCNIAIYADDTSVYSKCDQGFGLWQQLELASALEADIRHTGLWQEVAC